MRIILVRHGETEQNIGNGVGIIDQKVCLTDKGVSQSANSVEFIQNHIKNSIESQIYVYYSPYQRTMDMATMLMDKLPNAKYFQEPLVSEIQCGDFSGYVMRDYEKHNKAEYDKFMQYKKISVVFGIFFLMVKAHSMYM